MRLLDSPGAFVGSETDVVFARPLLGAVARGPQLGASDPGFVCPGEDGSPLEAGGVAR